MGIPSSHRHKGEEGNNVSMDSGAETFISDLMIHVEDVAYPVAELEWDTDLLTSQKAAAAIFVGASESQVREADIGQRITIATEGKHLYDCDEVGTEGLRAFDAWVGFAENDAGDALENQKVVVVDDEDAAIGKVIRASAGEEVLIRLFGVTSHL